MGTTLEVLYDFAGGEGEEEGGEGGEGGGEGPELCVGVGDLVRLVCPHDRAGSGEWWLVETLDCVHYGEGRREGYVPSNYMCPVPPDDPDDT